jgi:hypothetical protein
MTVFKRFLIIFGALGLGVLLVWFLTYFGDRSKGPVEDFLSRVGSSVTELEQHFILGNRADRRKDTLQWLEAFKHPYSLRDFPDTIFLGIYDNSTQESLYPIVELEDELGLHFPIIHIYTAWGSKEEQEFPLKLVKAIHNLGSIPMITWEPWLTDIDIQQVDRGLKPDKGGLAAISRGEYDFYLEQWIEEVKKFSYPIFVRFGHEMNDPYRYPWGPQNNDPEDFIAAWRHVVRFFRIRGADHVIWIWSPHPAYPPYKPYYPGDDFVDWVGAGALNYGTAASWSQWWTFDDIIGKYYPLLSEYNKPVMITEFASLAVGGDRAAWYRDALDSVQIHYPDIDAFVFFNHHADHSTTYKSLDWSIEGDSMVVRAVRRALGVDF